MASTLVSWSDLTLVIIEHGRRVYVFPESTQGIKPSSNIFSDGKNIRVRLELALIPVGVR